MILEIINIALKSLRANKLRTFLSMLGIIIGVGAVIAIVSIGTGTQQRITADISNLGSNLIEIGKGFSRGRGGISSTADDIFTVEMANYMEQTCPDIKRVLPKAEANGRLIKGDNNLQTTVIGTEAAYQQIYDYYPAQGKFITPVDLEAGSNAIVLGSQLVSELFPAEKTVLGKKIKFNYQDRILLFTVVGIMEEKGTGGPMGDLNDQAYIPTTTYLNKLANSNYVNGYTAQAASSQVASQAVSQLEYFLLKRIGDEDEFRIMSQDQILDTISNVTKSMSLMLGGIAAISLVVGGIGIMNIMLVSVTERTREIGVRKALGVKKKDILTQFVIESLALSGFGGILGIGFGYLGAYVISKVGDWPFIVSPLSVVIAFSFSLLIGLFFGIYPAKKAADLDPVDALSYE